MTAHAGPSAAAIKAAAPILAEAEMALREGTVEEAARRAYTPTGPSIPELERRIREIRARDRSVPA
jgi:hypothetical protein